MYTINITERASESVNDALQEHEHLRLSAKPGGCSGWKWDLQTEDDLDKTSMDEVFTTDYGFNFVISKASRKFFVEGPPEPTINPVISFDTSFSSNPASAIAFFIAI